MDEITGIYYKMSWVQPPSSMETQGKETLVRELHLIRDGNAVVCDSVIKENAESSPVTLKSRASLEFLGQIDDAIPDEIFSQEWVKQKFGNLIPSDSTLVARVVVQKQYANGKISGPSVVMWDYIKNTRYIPDSVLAMEMIIASQSRKLQ